MLAPNQEFLENQTAPSESPEPLVKPVEEGGYDTRPDLGTTHFSPWREKRRCAVWHAARLI